VAINADSFRQNAEKTSVADLKLITTGPLFMNAFIRWFSEISSDDLSVVGGEFAEIFDGFRIGPNGFSRPIRRVDHDGGRPTRLNPNRAFILCPLDPSPRAMPALTDRGGGRAKTILP
jgi:hypothetical protein